MIESFETPTTTDGNGIVVEGIPVHGLHTTEEGELYVSYWYGGRFHVEPIRSRRFKRYIRAVIYANDQKAAKDAKVRELTSQFAAECEFHGSKVHLWNRFGRDGAHILVDGINRVYRVGGGKWEEIELAKPIFRRPAGMLPLPEPVRGGDLKQLLNFVNIRHEESKILFLVHVVAAMIPDIPHPAIIFYGPQGSSKSSILRRYNSLLDPVLNEDVPFRNEREFMLAASQRWVLGMDNVSFLDEAASAIACKLVTGACYTARVLYTDDDLMIRRFRRVVIINGINLPVDKSDLMDRCVLMPLDRIPAEQRRTEAELDREFDAIKGHLLGGCLDALARAMEIYHTIKNSTLERMADFQIWGCAIAQALGYSQQDFLNAWAKNIELQHEEALDASPVSALIFEWFRKNKFSPSLQGSPTHVYRQLKGVAEDAGIDERSLPRTPLSFGRKLQEVRSNLEAHGFVLERTRGKERTIFIGRPKSMPAASKSEVVAAALAQYAVAPKPMELLPIEPSLVSDQTKTAISEL